MSICVAMNLFSIVDCHISVDHTPCYRAASPILLFTLLSIATYLHAVWLARSFISVWSEHTLLALLAFVYCLFQGPCNLIEPHLLFVYCLLPHLLFASCTCVCRLNLVVYCTNVGWWSELAVTGAFTIRLKSP
jgi:hypothetical protein